MDFGKIVANPVVIIGGIGLGLILIMSNKSSASNSGSSSGGSSVYASPAYTSSIMAYNTAALGAVTQQYSIQADVAKYKLNTDVTRDVATLDYIKNQSGNQAQIQLQTLLSNQGVFQATTAANAAVTIDRQQNDARLTIAGLQTQTDMFTVGSQSNVANNQTAAAVTIADIQGNTAVKVAQTQASAVKTAAKYNAIGAAINGIVGVGTAIATGGASLFVPQASAAASSGTMAAMNYSGQY